MDIQKVMQQAQELQKKMQKAQEELESIEITGTAGAGDDMVTITITGKGLVTKVNISPRLMDIEDKSMTEDLTAAAFNNAKSKLDEVVGGKMAALNIPAGLLG